MGTANGMIKAAQTEIQARLDAVSRAAAGEVGFAQIKKWSAAAHGRAR